MELSANKISKQKVQSSYNLDNWFVNYSLFVSFFLVRNLRHVTCDHINAVFLRLASVHHAPSGKKGKKKLAIYLLSWRSRGRLGAHTPTWARKGWVGQNLIEPCESIGVIQQRKSQLSAIGNISGLMDRSRPDHFAQLGPGWAEKTVHFGLKICDHKHPMTVVGPSCQAGLRPPIFLENK